MTDIRVQDVTSATAWDAYVHAASMSTCFHLYGWRAALSGVLGYKTKYFAAYVGEQIVGILPVAVVRSHLFGNSVVSLPFCSYGGVVADSAEARLSLENAALEFAKAESVNYLELRSLQSSEREHKIEDTYFTFRKQIPNGPAELTFLPSKRRNMVRKAIAGGLSYQINNDINVFFDLYAENARAHGTPALPKKFFDVLKKSLGEACDILLVLDKSSTPVSAIMSFYAKGSVHAGFAGELPQARELAANDFKYWSLYQHAKSRDCTEFDLGRSKVNTGSYEFKKLWGLTPSPIVHSFELFNGGSPPNNNPNNPKFALAMQTWSKLPRVLVDFLGPKVINGLG